MSQIQEQRIKKQKYLRQNIQSDSHEDFGEFCQTFAGQIDIDAWQFAYLEDLVRKFKEKKLQQQVQLNQANINQQSFHIYQTSNQNQIKQLAQKITQEKTKQQKYQTNTENLKKQKKNTKNASELLENAFKNPTVNQNDFSTVSNLFHNTNYWGIQALNQQDNFKSNQNFNTTKCAIQKPNETKKDNTATILNNEIPKPNFSKKKKNNEEKKQGENNAEKKEGNKNNTQNKAIEKKEVDNKNIELNNDNKNNVQQNERKIQENKQQNNSSLISQKIQTEKSEVSQVSKNNKQVLAKTDKIPYKGKKIIKDEFEDTVECFKSTIRQALAHPDLLVTIQQHQIISKNFFAQDYVMYFVKTMPNNYECKRNYQDFLKLRKSLSEVYPAVQLPYLEKTSWFSETNPEQIKKQKLILQAFIQDIILNKQLRNARIFEDFLTIKQHKKMKRKFQQFDRLAKVKSIQELCLLSGEVNVKLKDQQRIYQQKISSYLVKMEEYFDRHKKLSDSLKIQYQGLMGTYSSLSDLMKQVSIATKQFNRQVSCNQINNLDKTYENLSEVYQEGCKNIAFDLNQLNEKMIPFLRYQSENLGTIREVINLRNSMTKQYLKRSQNEPAVSNTEAYKNEQCKIYKLNITQQSKSMVVFKFQTAYLNNQVCLESQRMFELLGYKINRKIEELSTKHLQKLKQSNFFWNKITM